MKSKRQSMFVMGKKESLWHEKSEVKGYLYLDKHFKGTCKDFVLSPGPFTLNQLAAQMQLNKPNQERRGLRKGRYPDTKKLDYAYTRHADSQKRYHSQEFFASSSSRKAFNNIRFAQCQKHSNLTHHSISESFATGELLHSFPVVKRKS